MTFRAVEVLKDVDLILAEDTRHSKRLLDHFNIDNRILSYHQHNEHKILPKIMAQLKGGQVLAMISDAGMPGISDPGFLLVRECIRENIEVISLPGPTAFVNALVNSGLPADRFCFEGFLPHKKGRQKRLKALVDEERTMIFYESPYRVKKLLKELLEYFGEDRRVSVSRELTKLHEETRRGTVAEALEYFEKKEPKGEFVVIAEGNTKK